MKNCKKMFVVLLLLAAVSRSNAANIIPADRRTDWTPGVTVGVPGGIPHRTTVGATVDAARFGTGSVDASAAIGAAIDACPQGQVVFIPAGTYRVDKRVYRAGASGITIRGAGVGKTILKANSKAEVLLLGAGDWPRPKATIAVTGGAVKGSTVLTVADASRITVGRLVRLEQDDAPYVISRQEQNSLRSNTKCMTVMFKVTAKTATTVTVAPPLPMDFKLSPGLALYQRPALSSTGIEDLTIDGNSLSGIPIEIVQSWACWVQNVEIKKSTSRQMFLVGFVSGEVRHCYTHDVVGGGPGHEGIDLYEDGCFNLIEDNITYNGGYPGIVLGDWRGGCAGNVIAYNFAYAAKTGVRTMAGEDISVSHGAHNVMNLVEGNIAGGMASDGYHGSASHVTVLRNWFTATHPSATENLMAVNVGRWNNYFNLVGNILGTSSFSSKGMLQPERPFDYQTQVIYKLGFPNMGNDYFEGTWEPTTPPNYRPQPAHQAGGKSLQELDLNVKNTMIRQGNFDYLSHTIGWDREIADHAIPKSYFRTSKPDFFGNLDWPPFDPASPPGDFNDANLSRIPAGYRYVHGSDPPGDAGSPGAGGSGQRKPTSH